MRPPLAGLSALDLTDALGYLCGRLLADLGVLVIKVEPPGGDGGRALAPRYRARDGREHGLYWHAMNAGKLGVTLALEHPQAPRVLADLAARVHFVLDSFPPDSAEARLVAELAAARPALVHTSVTAFGDRPPGRALHADDIVIAAMGGSMYLCGDEDRPPLRLPLWQAYCHAGAEAAVGTLLAHLARGRSGRGQHVVVSAIPCSPAGASSSGSGIRRARRRPTRATRCAWRRRQGSSAGRRRRSASTLRSCCAR